MSDVTRILSAIEQGDPHAAEQLLPLDGAWMVSGGGAGEETRMGGTRSVDVLDEQPVLLPPLGAGRMAEDETAAAMMLGGDGVDAMDLSDAVCLCAIVRPCASSTPRRSRHDRF
jgi:hypothetical protein